MRFFCSPAHPDELINGTAKKQKSWKQLYPKIDDRQCEFADIGCGYGGFLVGLGEYLKYFLIFSETNFNHFVGEIYPDKIALGMEIRMKVSEYVQERIESLRKLHPGQYENIACVRANSMKNLVNYFHKGQLTKMFFLFPDPHFKKSKHKRRIINPSNLSEYAYLMAKGVSAYFKFHSINLIISIF